MTDPKQPAVTLIARLADGKEYSIALVMGDPAEGVTPSMRQLLHGAARGLERTAIIALEAQVPRERRDFSYFLSKAEADPDYLQEIERKTGIKVTPA